MRDRISTIFFLTTIIALGITIFFQRQHRYEFPVHRRKNFDRSVTVTETANGYVLNAKLAGGEFNIPVRETTTLYDIGYFMKGPDQREPFSCQIDSHSKLEIFFDKEYFDTFHFHFIYESSTQVITIDDDVDRTAFIKGLDSALEEL